MFCPRCKAEFVKGIQVCPDCEVELVWELPPETKEKPFELHADEEYEVVKLMNLDNKLQVDLIINLLENNGISCFKKPNGAGGYLDLYSGTNIYGEDIFVHKQDYADAYTLCKEFLEEGEVEVEEDIEFEKEVAKMREQRQIMNRAVTFACRMILVLGIGITVITCITDWFF